MKVLSEHRYKQARAFLMECARPLETALFAYHFEDAAAGGVLTALAEAPHLPEHHSRELAARIREAIPEVIVRDPDLWDTYCIKPLGLAPRPDTLGAELIQEEIENHLDYVIENQSPEGCWAPAWSWGENYSKVWPQARREWQGILTFETLISLEAYGRIA